VLPPPPVWSNERPPEAGEKQWDIYCDPEENQCKARLEHNKSHIDGIEPGPPRWKGGE
jgi:hypothetical protein